MRLILAISVLLCAAPFAHAEETSSSTSSTGSSDPFKNKKFRENGDITDMRMKAQTGSLSRYSLHMRLNYAGPPVGDLGALDQPNPDHMSVTRATAITGSAGARYRLSSRSTISLTTGISYQYPFREENRLDVNNPGMSYEYAFRWGEVQMISSPGVTLTTAKASRSIGERGGVSYNLAAVKNLGESRFSVGLDTRWSYFFFDRPYILGTTHAINAPTNGTRHRLGKSMNATGAPATPVVIGDGRVSQASASLGPSVKFRCTDYIEVNTGASLSYYHPRYVPDGESSIQRRTISQNLGLAYAFSREIYISPFLQFYPTQFTWRDTSFNVSAIFSVL